MIANIKHKGFSLPHFSLDYSLVNPLKNLMTKHHPRPAYIDGISILQLIEKAVLIMYLTDLPALFTEKEMYLMEIGFARLKTDDGYFLKAIVDEPLAIAAGLKFLNKNGDMERFVVNK